MVLEIIVYSWRFDFVVWEIIAYSWEIDFVILEFMDLHIHGDFSLRNPE